ncbi:hypothetical protein APX70_200070 [Pseudomonas syringae pv. maculicola]|uniref:Uncharacterized protein n=1 Tax=Pseudomonas syringae pv. maculicola TaxID=59511 RepID=A0A3M3A8V6_PSEYM|nr:hypothetical protein APX70_200070 [Pseudomonas syringae pv. maculicola]
MMTSTMPHARMPVMDICRSRLERLRGVRNPPSVYQLKNSQITAMAITSASIL